MGNIHHFLCQCSNLPPLECHKILKFLGRNAVLVVVVTLVNNEFGAEFIAHFLFKLLQNIRRNGSRISVPIHILFPSLLIKEQGKLMKEGCVPNNIYIGMVCNEFSQALHGKYLSLRLANIKGNLMLYILPAINYSIVHVHRIPHNKSQEAYGILMEGLCLWNHHHIASLLILPLCRWHNLASSSVDNLPPTLSIQRIYLQHFWIQALHERNG